MRTLSKSRLTAVRQCPICPWLELHHSERHEHASAGEVGCVAGHELGVVAQGLHDPEGEGEPVGSRKVRLRPAFAGPVVER